MVAITLTISAILAIVVGILILIFPKFLRLAIGIYLIIIGFLQLLNIRGILLAP